MGEQAGWEGVRVGRGMGLKARERLLLLMPCIQAV